MAASMFSARLSLMRFAIGDAEVILDVGPALREGLAGVDGQCRLMGVDGGFDVFRPATLCARQVSLAEIGLDTGPENRKCCVRERGNKGAISSDVPFVICICTGLLRASQANGYCGPLATPPKFELERSGLSGLFDTLDKLVEAGRRLPIQRHDDIGGLEAGFVRRAVRGRQDDQQGIRLIEAERLDGGGVQVSQFGAEPAGFGWGGLGCGGRSGRVLLRDCERCLRRQEQQRGQRAAKRRAKRFEGNACNICPVHGQPPNATHPIDN